MKYIDIHSHLNDSRFDEDRADVLARMRGAQVATIVVGTDRKMSEDAIMLAEAHPDMWATIGLHPTDNYKEEFDDALYAKLATHSRVVAIGECGLDYYWPSVNQKNQHHALLSAAPVSGQDISSSPLQHSSSTPRIASDSFDSLNSLDYEKNRQRELFEKQIAIAKKVDKPLMIHGRPSKGSMDAYEDILDILKGSAVRGNVHFFVGNTDIAKRFLDIGFTMSFTGVITFTHDYDDVIQYIPLASIMSETDAPYVAPVPYRGKRNEPLYVRETVAEIARIRGEDPDKTAEALCANALCSFRLH